MPIQAERRHTALAAKKGMEQWNDDREKRSRLRSAKMSRLALITPFPSVVRVFWVVRPLSCDYSSVLGFTNPVRHLSASGNSIFSLQQTKTTAS